MDGLQPLYQGKIDFTKIDVSTQVGLCEFEKHGFRAYPAMIYIDKTGNQVATTEQYQDYDQLKQRLDNLLNQ